MLPDTTKPFLLSSEGSTRATAYNPTNKSVRIGDVTYLTWLDAVSKVKVRQFDHATGAWSDTIELGEGADNHCNPALSASPDGVLRIAYGPHAFWEEGMFNHARFRIQHSADGLTWTHAGDVGYGATYACLLCDSQGRDHLVYRGGIEPHGVLYERRLPVPGCWDLLTKLSVRREKPDYTFVNASLAIGPGDVLYCGFMYYYLEWTTQQNTNLGICGLKSVDGGVTWTGIDGRPVTLPLAYDPAFAIPHIGANPYLGSLTVDLDGNLVAFTHDFGEELHGVGAPDSSLLSVYRDGRWESTPLDRYLPAGWQVHLGQCTVDARGRILVVVDATYGLEGSRWGHPSLECFLLASADGGRTFTCTQISETDPTTPNWLPNISRNAPNHDLRTPLILYTHGAAGETCKPQDRTEVYGVWVG
jgi:hypothetical protein